MSDHPQSNGKSDRLPGRGILLAGFLVLWAASIALALVLKTLLTPENYPAGSDPSFEIALATFCLILCLLGILLIIRGLLEEEGRLEGSPRRIIKSATIGAGIALGIVFVVSTLLFSANSAFAAQFKPRILYQPRPDYSVPDFPTPALSQPIPTFDPKGRYLFGAVNASMDGLRVGDILISVSPTDGSILSFEITLNRILCTGQAGGTVTTYAVEVSKQLITGPVEVQPDGTFFAAQDNVSLHGVLISQDEMRGTLYLRYVNPANQQTCDLGTFEWNAKSTDKTK